MCLHQDRGERVRRMDGLIPTLNNLYEQGRMTWTEQEKGWIGLPEEMLGALTTDGFYECQRGNAASSIGHQPAEGTWHGVNPRTKSVASVTWTVRRAPEAPMVFIEIDGESLTHPAPALAERQQGA
jgi:hypothetical protein